LPDCALLAVPGHRHIALNKGKQERRIDIEPIFWAPLATRPGFRRTVVLAAEVALLIGLVDLIAASARAGTASWRGLVGVLGRAVFVPVLGFPLAVVLAMVFNREFGDAFAWGTDHRDSRARISAHVRARLKANRADSIVLLGHSQGGSILASIEREVRAAGVPVRLVTLGTGTALLAAVNEIRPGWRVDRSIVLWLAWLVTALVALPLIVVAAGAMVGQTFAGIGVMTINLDFRTFWG